MVVDTSVLRQAPFGHSEFERLLRRAKRGELKIYIPHIVLEEQRTSSLATLEDQVEKLRSDFAKLIAAGGSRALTQGLPDPILAIWTKEDLAQNSRHIFDKFIAENKIERLEATAAHGTRAWERYFDAAPPFNRNEPREKRRKDIPDSWILEAALEIRNRRGRHCALVADGRLGAALKAEGFEVYVDVASLDAVVEDATRVVASRASASKSTSENLSSLRSPSFDNVDLAIMGLNEALGTPSKDVLFSMLERAGFDRGIVEHEAQTLVLSGRLQDAGSHLIPIDRALAEQAKASEQVGKIIVRILP